MEKMKIKERVNWPVTILLLLGLITVAFPLYMTIVIALKKPSEMTNSISGILSLPSHLSFDNFAEAMRVTDFWHSLGNSVFITLVTVVLSICITGGAATLGAAFLAEATANQIIGAAIGQGLKIVTIGAGVVVAKQANDLVLSAVWHVEPEEMTGAELASGVISTVLPTPAGAIKELFGLSEKAGKILEFAEGVCIEMVKKFMQ